MGITGGGGGYVVGDGEKKLAEGARVEVRMTEKGLRGSWHPAVVTAVKPGTRVVEYEELVSDDGSGRKLKEMISVGRGVDGLRASSRQFSKTPPSSKRTRILLRPQPPVLSSLGKASWSKGLWVDVFWKDAWWEGILVEDILSERAGAKAVVYFPDEGGQEMCLVKDLRLRQEWDEDTGNWSFKGRAELLELQDPSAFKKGPEFAVKKLNFDKKLPFFALTDDVGSPAGVAAKEGEKCRSGLASQRLERLKRKHGCPPNGRMGVPPASSPDYSSIPTYCISNLLRGLEASAQGGEVAIVAGGVDDSCSPPKEEQDGDCHPMQQLLAGTTKEKPAAKVMTATESKPPTTLSCNGKSNHNTEEEEEEEAHLSLLPQAIEHHPQAKKSRVSKGRETPEAAIHSHQDFKMAEIAMSLRSHEQLKMAEIPMSLRSHEQLKMAEIAMSLRSHEQQRVANPESRGNTSGASPKCVTAMGKVIAPPCSGGEDESARTEQLQQQMSSSMLGKEAQADDETLEMLLIEHKAQVRKCRIANGKETPAPPPAAPAPPAPPPTAAPAPPAPPPTAAPSPAPHSQEGNQSENVRNVMVLRNRQCKAVRRKESEVVELIEESRGDGMVLTTTTEKSCRKRVSIHNCSSSSLEMEHRSKKNRWSSAASEEAATATLAGSSSCLTHEEGMGGKKGVRKGGASSSSVHERRRKQKGARGGCRMEVLLSQPEDPVLDDGKNLYTKKNTLSWLIEAGVLHKDQKLRYMYRRKELGVGGWVMPEGVLCGCCNDVVTLSTFETHCGSKLHRPCANIFVEDGRSIAALQMEALKKQMSSVKMSSSSFHKGNRRGNLQVVKDSVLDVNDDTCGVCGDGGMLICCDHCPSTFHLKCMELMVVPEEDWYCPNCRCAICGGSQFNGSHDTFDEMSVLFCDQCEREFHVKCLYARGMPKMEQWPQNSWFCGNSCERIYRGLRGLVGTNNFLGEGFSWTLLRSQDEDPDPKTEVDKELLAEQNIKLSIALSVMQECFRPMIDPRTKVDVIAHALYNRGSDINRLNYHGFYTMILEKGDELISVAAIRVHGAVLAEMPLIGTRFQYRRQGMCRRLLHAIEQMLQMVGVETLVLPAVPELLDTWTGAFDFKPMDTFPRQTLIELNLMAFPGTSLLHKSLPGLQAHPPIADEEAKVCGNEVQQLAMLKGGLLKSARVTRSTTARVGAMQFVAGKVSDEVQGTEIGSSRTQSGKFSEPDVGDDEQQGAQSSSASTAILDSPSLVSTAVAPSWELLDLLMYDEHVQKVLEQVVTYGDKKFSKLGFDDVPGSTPCIEEDGLKNELLQHQCNGFQHDRQIEKESSPPKQEDDDVYRTKVVVATTRYNRKVKSARWVADAMNKLRRHSSTQAHTSPVQTDLCCIGRLSEDEHIIDGEALPVTVHQSSSSSKLLAETDVKKPPHASSSLSEPETLTPSGSENLICLMLRNPKQKQKQNKKNKNKMDKEEEQHYSDQKNVQGGEALAVFCESNTNQTMQQDSGDMNTTNQLSDNPVQESLSLSKASSLLDSSPTSSLPSTAGQTLDDGLQKVVIIWEDTVVKMPPLATREGLKCREGMIDQAVGDGSFSIMPAVDADYQLLPMLKKRFDCTSSSSSDEMILYLDGLSSNQNLPTAVEVLPENRVGG